MSRILPLPWFDKDDALFKYECPDGTPVEEQWHEADSILPDAVDKVQVASGAGCTVSITVDGNYAEMRADVGVDGATWGCSSGGAASYKYCTVERGDLPETLDYTICYVYEADAKEVTLSARNSPAGGSTMYFAASRAGFIEEDPGFAMCSDPEPEVKITAEETITKETASGSGSAAASGVRTESGATLPAIITSGNTAEGDASSTSTTTGAPPSTVVPDAPIASTAIATSSLTATASKTSGASATSTSNAEPVSTDDSALIGGLSNTQLGLIVGGVVLVVVATVIGLVCMRKKSIQAKGDALPKEQERSLQKGRAEKGAVRTYSALTSSPCLFPSSVPSLSVLRARIAVGNHAFRRLAEKLD
ncbi:hypothetical protein JCM11251_001779 [Rhodosporidiobolus azoricus]